MQVDQLLGSLPLFAKLSPQQLGWLQALLESETFQAGEDIFRQGSPADGLRLLRAGQAIAFKTAADGSQLPVAQFEAGQALNEEALFTDAVQAVTLRAAAPTSALLLRAERFRQLLAEKPELRQALGMAGDGEAKPILNPRFAEQREDEEILIQTHRHWWAFLRAAWLPLLLMPALWGGAFVLEAQALSLAALALSFLLPGSALVYFYLEWRNDSVIVTDQRVIRIERTIVTMMRQVTQIGMESIHEININMPARDPFSRLLRYGTVLIKTAGAQGNLELDFMPKPYHFQQLIIENRNYFEKRQAQRQQKLVQAEVQRWMAGEPGAEAAAATSPSGAPRPLKGSKGYLSTRIEMSNGDIVYRKHISVWLQHTALPIVIVIAGLILLGLTFTVISEDWRAIAFPAGMLALALGSLAYYWMDWDWRNDVYIIADDTITLAHKRPFFLQNLRDQILVERIDNVESISSGLFASLLRYGDVRLSLIGADEPKLFQRVANPQAVQQEISRRQHNISQRRALLDARQQREMLGEYLSLPPAARAQSAAANQPVSAASLIRPANNTDRNRPPRVARKLPAAPQPAADAGASLAGSRRRLPARFRRNRQDGSAS